MSKIVCPNCNTPIDIDEVLYRQLEREAKEQLRREIEEHRQKYRAAMSELKAKEEALKEQESRLQAEARRRAEELLEKRLAEGRKARPGAAHQRAPRSGAKRPRRRAQIRA